MLGIDDRTVDENVASHLDDYPGWRQLHQWCQQVGISFVREGNQPDQWLDIVGRQELMLICITMHEQAAGRWDRHYFGHNGQQLPVSHREAYHLLLEILNIPDNEIPDNDIFGH